MLFCVDSKWMEMVMSTNSIQQWQILMILDLIHRSNGNLKQHEPPNHEEKLPIFVLRIDLGIFLGGLTNQSFKIC